MSGQHSVLVVVVERDPAQWRESLASLHGDLFGPGKTDALAPVRLEVIDRATDEAIQRLMAAGLVAKATRASRPLLAEANAAETSPLSEEEKSKARSHRERGARKLKMAKVLAETGFIEEARPALLEAIQEFGRALATETRLHEPANLEDSLIPPLSHRWGESLPALKDYVANPATAPGSLIEQLEKHPTWNLCSS